MTTFSTNAGLYSPVKGTSNSMTNIWIRPYVKSIVYKNAPDNIADLRQRIIRGFREIRTDPNVCHRVRNSFDRRIRSCIRAEGGHFKHI